MVHTLPASSRVALVALALLGLLSASAAHAASVLLNFTSPHCGPCHELKPTIARLQAEGYPVRVVDVTSERALTQQFGVTRVPCLVLVTDGREQARLQGVTSYQKLREVFDAAGVKPLAAGAKPVSQVIAHPQVQRGQSPDNPWNRPQEGGRPALDPATRIPPSPAAQLEAGQSPIPVGGGGTPAVAYVAPGEFEQRLLKCSVRIKVEDSSGHSFGTGTVIDKLESDALVVTCGHLFRGEAAKGTITIEVFEAGPQGLRVVDRIPGRLESFDLESDVGLVSFKPRTPVAVAKVALQPVGRVNEPVWSVGCDRGADPTVRSSRVTALQRYDGPPNLETSGAPVEGRSGGGLFNSQGELVGVCFAADPAADEGLYAAIPSIHAELDNMGLARIYNPAVVTAQVAAASERRLAPLPNLGPGPAVIRGQDPGSSLEPASSLPVASAVATSVNGVPEASPATPSLPTAVERLAPHERAALVEIAQRAAQAEVVCVVRSREPGGASEVIHLENVSSEFLAALRAMQPADAAPR